MAAMNFVNLTTANSLTRIKEIGIKKVVGCRKGSLVKQFLYESLIIVFISLLIAFTITEAILPVFNRIVSLPLDFSYIKDWQFTLFIIGITFTTGILSGLYPALVLSSLSPIDSLKGKLFNNSRMKNFSIRKRLVIIQLVMSVSFVMISLSILNQFNYLKNKDLGFDKNNLLISKIGGSNKVKINEFSVLRSELLQLPGVTDISVSYNSPFNGSWSRNINWEGGQAGEFMNSRYNRATATFIPTMKIDMVEGRNFNDHLASDSAACIVNQRFVNIIGWSCEEAIGKKVWDNSYSYTIVGIMKDFHENTPYIQVQPYLLTYHPGYLTGGKQIIVRVNDISDKKIFGQIKTKLEEYFPESYLEVRSYDNNLGEGTYTIYLGLAKTFGFFSIISIFIAIIGLFAFVSYSEKRRVKEIGIRKILGASSMQIYKKLAYEYMVLVMIADAIAIPLGTIFYFIDPSYYKQRISVNEIFWTCLLSIIVILLTISIQVIKLSYTNPVNSLRYE
jgi:putative ABC transport system permease protein